MRSLLSYFFLLSEDLFMDDNVCCDHYEESYLVTSIIFVLFLNLNIMADDPVLLQLVRKDMDVNEHERISNITLRHKLR